MVIIMKKVGENPYLTSVENNLKEMQKLVGGYIEECMPFEDYAAIIRTRNGKNEGLPFNTYIVNEEESIIEEIYGDFFICYAPPESEEYISIPPGKLVKKYMNMFKEV